MGESEFYKVLYNISRSLYSQQTTKGVLEHVVRVLNTHFPQSVSHLYMSQDTESKDTPILPLIFSHNDDDILTQAFIDGKTILASPDAPEEEAGDYAAAVPLIGRQGVYGVLELRSSRKPLDDELALLEAIGSTAGMAFENAKLYEQSNMLITELRIINEMTRRLNQSLCVLEIFQYACDEFIEVFQADCAWILGTDAIERKFVVQATNVTDMQGSTYDFDSDISGIIYKTKEPIIISDNQRNSVIHSAFMTETGSRSFIGAPILVNDEVAGAVLISHKEPHYFTYDNYKLLLLLAGHIGLAIMKAQFHAELNRMVITDNLTGLYARKYLDEQVQALQTKDARGALILVDIDNFKGVNDTFGHQVGDEILKQVSSIIRSSIRETDIAARWGGEELAIYLPQLTLEQTERVAERIRSRVEKETKPAVTVSCGIAEWSQLDERVSVEILFYKADMAMYEAKNNGKNQYRIG